MIAQPTSWSSTTTSPAEPPPTPSTWPSAARSFLRRSTTPLRHRPPLSSRGTAGSWWSVPFTEDLGSWVARQRWYAGKGHEPRFRILDTQPVIGAKRYLLMVDTASSPHLFPMHVVAGER